MTVKIIICILIVIVPALVMCADYCNICRNKQKHIACGANPQPSPKCSSIPKVTPEIQNLIVDLHNEYRNRQAMGEMGFPTAARMATVTWDDELAYVASLNAKRCKFDHDACRATARFPYAGQNIAAESRSNGFPSLISVIKKETEAWFNEYKNAPQDEIDAFGRQQTPKQIGHFTQMVRDESYKIGCAISQYVERKPRFTGHTVYYVCNYAVTNMINRPIYEKGAPASKCKTGTNAKYPGLCSVNEIYEGSSFN